MKNNVNKIVILFFVTLAIGVSQDDYSLSFDGVDDYVEIPTIDLSYGNEISISMWIEAEDITSNYNNVLIRQEGNEPIWLLAFDQSGQILEFGLNTTQNYSELEVDINAIAMKHQLSEEIKQDILSRLV